MITSEREYGAYKLAKCHFFDDFENENELPDRHVSTCYLGAKWTSLPLESVVKYNHDTSIFRFRLPDPTARLNLPVGGIILARGIGVDHDGTDAVRPYSSITENSAQGYFEILCKRYDEWGQKESPETHFLFTQTNHSYKPPGALSDYIHKLKPGDTLDFKHNEKCLPRFEFPIPGVTSLTLIAVGVGLAPMIQLLRYVFAFNRAVEEEDAELLLQGETQDTLGAVSRKIKVVLLYGVREVEDILLKEQLEYWRDQHEFITDGTGESDFRVVYCVGTRWGNVHMGVFADYLPPSTPSSFDLLRNAETGWVNEDKVRRHAFRPSASTRVMVCGLPGVYDKLCGSRNMTKVPPHSILGRLGFTEDMVIKY